MIELQGIKEVFGDKVPPTALQITTGHSLGATGVQEVVYSFNDGK